jgi:hypothetical protein
MNCPECQEAFAAYIEGLLEKGPSNQLDEHLAGCPACREALEVTRRLVARLAGNERHAFGPPFATSVMDRIIREQSLQLRRNEAMQRRIVSISVAAILLIGLGLVLANPHITPSGRKVYADDLKAARNQAENARTASWSIAYYEHYQSKDGAKRKWFKDRNNNQKYYYMTPGVYRCESFGPDGEIVFVSIEDVTNRTKLDVNHRNKTATLTHLIERGYNPKGPFAKYLEVIENRDLLSLGTRSIAGRAANGFRNTFTHEGVNKQLSFDFWLDSDTKRLVLCKDPGDDIFDSDEIVSERGWDTPNDIEYEGATYKRKSDRFGEPGESGHIIDAITFDEELNDSLFSFEPPEGYQFKTVHPPEFEEKDVVEFMGIVAEYFDRIFPDRLPNFFRGNKAEYERFERVENSVMKRGAATPAERNMVEGVHKWWRLGFPGTGPINVYIQERIVDGSWKYLGKGVRLGEGDRIICWYRPKGSQLYHVVYGDLSVKEVEREKLPLPMDR